MGQRASAQEMWKLFEVTLLKVRGHTVPGNTAKFGQKNPLQEYNKFTGSKVTYGILRQPEGQIA